MSDALDDAAEFLFTDSVARSSHSAIGSESSPLSRRAMPRYVNLYRPAVGLPPDVLARYPAHKRPSLSDIQELAGKGPVHTTNDDIVLLVRNPTSPPIMSDNRTLWHELLDC